MANFTTIGIDFIHHGINFAPCGQEGEPKVKEYSITFTSSGTSKFWVQNFGGNTPNIEYSLDKETWTPAPTSSGSGVSFSTIYVRGANPAGVSSSPTAYSTISFSGFEVTAQGSIQYLINHEKETTVIPSAYCFYKLFENQTCLKNTPVLRASALTAHCYDSMFKGSGIVTPPALTAPTLTAGCYAHMFEGCAKLSSAPSLNVETLVTGCYQEMFKNCTSLVESPELPAEKLIPNCYESMFEGCSSLTTVQPLEFTEVATSSCASMFKDCTSLTTSPILLPQTLESHCYESMFEGCSSLVNVGTLKAVTAAPYSCASMFKDCGALEKLNELPFETTDLHCCESMFENDEKLVILPKFNVSSVKDYAFYKMFKNSGIKDVSALTLTDVQAHGCEEMFMECASLVTLLDFTCKTLKEYALNSMFKKSGIKNVGNINIKNTELSSMLSMFEECKNLKTVGDIVIINAAENCANYMFKDCEALQFLRSIQSDSVERDGLTWLAPGTGKFTLEKFLIKEALAYGCEYALSESGVQSIGKWSFESMGEGTLYHFAENAELLESIPAFHYDELPDKCFESAFNGCKKLATVAGFDASSVGVRAFYEAFKDCASLKAFPELVATTLAESCYQSMFDGSGLVNAPTLPATTLAKSCYQGMFQNCKKLEKGASLEAVTLDESCYREMYKNCIALTDASSIRAAVLANNCCQSMFEGCSVLETAPTLSAQNLKDFCYYQMFKDCVKLNYIKCAAIGLAATDATKNWCQNVLDPGEGAEDVCKFYTPQVSNWEEESPHGIPIHWTRHDLIPYAITLASTGTSKLSLNNVGGNNPNLEYSVDGEHWIPIPTDVQEAFEFQFCYIRGNNANGVSISPEQYTTINISGANCYASGDLIYLVDSPDEERPLTAVIPDNYCFYRLFKGCNTLITAPACATPSLKEHCYEETFMSCSILEEMPELPAQELKDSCYKSMFEDCRTLKQTTTLPAPILVPHCYEKMFKGCNDLELMKVAATNIEALDAFTNWMQDVAEVGVFKCVMDTPWPIDTPSGIPIYWAKRPLVSGISFQSTDGVKVYLKNYGTNSPDCEYTADAGATWKTMPTTEDKALQIATRIYVRGLNPTGFSKSATDYSTFTLVGAGSASCLNNIEGLIDYTDDLYADVPDYSFYRLFKGQNITTVPDLNGTTVGKHSYEEMFMNCESITEQATIPTTTVTYNEFSCKSMYEGCASLLEATTAKSHAKGVCQNMFKGCASVTKATVPTLSDPDFQESAYESCFEGCSSLAETNRTLIHKVNFKSFYNCFKDCSALAQPPFYAEDLLIWGTAAFYQCFQNCTSLVEACDIVYPANHTIYTNCFQSMYEGCTSLVTPHFYPCKEVQAHGMFKMFKGCTSLKTAYIHEQSSFDWAHEEQFAGCTSLDTIVDFHTEASFSRAFYKTFSGCTSLITIPDLDFGDCTGTTLSGAPNVADYMFENTKVKSVPHIIFSGEITKPLAQYMFKGSPLIEVQGPLDFGTLAEANVLNYMFANHTTLLEVGDINCVDTVANCFAKMFNGSNAIKKIGLITSEKLFATDCFKDCFTPFWSVVESLGGFHAQEFKQNCMLNLFRSAPKVSYIGEITSESSVESNALAAAFAEMNPSGKVQVDSISLKNVGNEGCRRMFQNTKLDKSFEGNEFKVSGAIGELAFAQAFNNSGNVIGTTIPSTTDWELTTVGLDAFSHCFDKSSVLYFPNIQVSGDISTRGFAYAFYDTTTKVTAAIDAKNCGEEAFLCCFAQTGPTEDSGDRIGEFNAKELGAKACKQMYMNGEFTVHETTSVFKFTSADEYTFQSMYQNCRNLTNHREFQNVLPSKPFICQYMYKDCPSLDAPCDISKFTGNNEPIGEYAFNGMFEDCDSFVSFTGFRIGSDPCGPHCFEGMFENCDNLIECATCDSSALAEACMKAMYKGCKSLTKTDSIEAPAELAKSCFEQKFMNCESLGTSTDPNAIAPLNILDLADSCYKSMFEGCKSLAKAPTLTATVCPDHCYQRMFAECVNLRSVRIAYVDKVLTSDNFCSEWLLNVPTEPEEYAGKFNRPDIADWSDVNPSFSGIPLHWEECDLVPNALIFYASGNDATVELVRYGTCNPNLEYSLDGETWRPWDGSERQFRLLYVRGTNPGGFSTSDVDYASFQFHGTAQSSILGNVNSLISTSTTTLLTLPGSYCFYKLFANNETLKNAQCSIPATTITDHAYDQMFAGCVNLLKCPTTIPAQVLSSYACYSMYKGCVNLNEGTNLPNVVSVGDHACASMFEHCERMVESPVVKNPTSIGISGFESMFDNCQRMIHYSNTLDTSVVASSAFKGMFKDCSRLVDADSIEFPRFALSSCESMFENCASLTTAPSIVTDTIPVSACKCMFKGCEALTGITEFTTGSIAEEGCYEMFMGCKSLVDFPDGINIPANISVNSCYHMFDGCESMNPEITLSNTVAPRSCFEGMFKGCKSLTDLSYVTLQAESINPRCYADMFRDCTSLTKAPEILSKKMSTECFDHMFTGAEALCEIKVHTKTAIDPTPNVFEWVKKVADSGDFYCYTTTPWIYPSISGIPLNWQIHPLDELFYLLSTTATSYHVTNYGGNDPNLEYSTDGIDWYAFTSPVSVAANKKFYVRGVDPVSVCKSATQYSIIDSDSATFEIGGELKYLANANDSSEVYNLPDYSFFRLFSGSNIRAIKGDWEFISRLGKYSCVSMFENCQNLEVVTPIKVSSAQDYACHGMFKNCDRLVNTASFPELTQAGPYAFYDTYINCDNLTSAIEFPKLNTYGEGTFMGCFENTSLTQTIPMFVNGEVPAYCFAEMYKGSDVVTIGSAISGNSVKIEGDTFERASAQDVPAALNPYAWKKGEKLVYTNTVLPAVGTLVFSSPTATESTLEIQNVQNVTTLGSNSCKSMFQDCVSLVSASSTFPSTISTQSCESMFQDCISLVELPELPATTVYPSSYASMFLGCTSISTIPELPATTVKENGYYQMFANCTSLVDISNRTISGLTLERNAYQNMFASCTSLEHSPLIMAEEVPDYAMQKMFISCIALTDIYSNLKQWTKYGTFEWVRGVATQDGEFHKIKYPEELDDAFGISFIPWTWQPQNSLIIFSDSPFASDFQMIGSADMPNLVQTTTNYEWKDFVGTTLNAVQNPADGKYYAAIRGDNEAIGKSVDDYWNVTGYYKGVKGKIGSMLDYKSPKSRGDYGVCGLFRDSMVQDASKLELNATPAKYEYANLFMSTPFSDPSLLPDLTKVTALSEGCFYQSFMKTRFVNPGITLHWTTLQPHCYEGMFRESSSLEHANAITIKADKCADYCCKSMFRECPNLVQEAYVLMTKAAEHCYEEMYYKCNSLVEIVLLNITSELKPYCYKSMYEDCTSLNPSNTYNIKTTSFDASHCCDSMFKGCTSLVKNIKFNLNNSVLGDHAFESTFENCSAMTGDTWYSGSISQVKEYGMYKMMKNATSYSNQFSSAGSTITTLGDHAMEEAFYHTKIPALGLTSVATIGVSSLEKICYEDTSLTTVNLGLTGLTLTERVLFEAFKGCSSLNNVTSGHTIWNCGNFAVDSIPTYHWLYGTALTGTLTLSNANYPLGASFCPYTWVDSKGYPLTLTHTAANNFTFSKVGTPKSASFKTWSNDEMKFVSLTASTSYSFVDDDNADFNGTTYTPRTGTKYYPVYGSNSSGIAADNNNYVMFNASSEFKLTGHIPSVTQGEYPKNWTANTPGAYAYSCLFFTSRVTDASALNLYHTQATMGSEFRSTFNKTTSLVTGADASNIGGTLGSYTFFAMYKESSVKASGASLTKLLPKRDCTLGSYSMAQMFYLTTNVTEVPNWSYKLGAYCYQDMFASSKVTKITGKLEQSGAPNSSYSHQRMFKSCASLTSVVEQSWSYSNTRAYDQMFMSCTALTSSPKITNNNQPGDYCYSEMFRGCTALTTSGDFVTSATACNQYAHQYMYYECSKLATVGKCPQYDTVGQYAWYFAYGYCTSMKSFTTTTPWGIQSAKSFGAWAFGYMFSHCSSLNTQPKLKCSRNALPSCADATFGFAFEYCTSLTDLSDGSISSWNSFDGNTGTNIFGYAWQYCTGITKAYVDIATGTTSGWYQYAWKGCTSLKDVGFYFNSTANSEPVRYALQECSVCYGIYYYGTAGGNALKNVFNGAPNTYYNIWAKSYAYSSLGGWGNNTGKDNLMVIPGKAASGVEIKEGWNGNKRTYYYTTSRSNSWDYMWGVWFNGGAQYLASSYSGSCNGMTVWGSGTIGSESNKKKGDSPNNNPVTNLTERYFDCCIKGTANSATHSWYNY